MFDEKDFAVAQFWKMLKKRIASRERSDDRQVDKALLQMLFIVALDRGLLSISAKKPIHFRHLLREQNDQEFNRQWRGCWRRCRVEPVAEISLTQSDSS